MPEMTAALFLITDLRGNNSVIDVAALQ